MPKIFSLCRCDVCKSLDGKEFDFYEEVPERPHPNCRCTVEIVEETSSNNVSETMTEDNDDTNRISSENQNPQISTPHKILHLKILHNHKDGYYLYQRDIKLQVIMATEYIQYIGPENFMMVLILMPLQILLYMLLQTEKFQLQVG